MSAVEFSKWFTLISFAFPLQLLSLHPLLCSTCLTFLLDIFWAIHQEFSLCQLLKNSQNSKSNNNKKNMVESFRKSRWLTAYVFTEVKPHNKRLSWNHWYHILMYFPNFYFHTSKRSYKKWKDIPSSLRFSSPGLITLSVFT